MAGYGRIHDSLVQALARTDATGQPGAEPGGPCRGARTAGCVGAGSTRSWSAAVSPGPATEAAELIAAGRVLDRRARSATKPATAVDPGAALLVRDDEPTHDWASRGAHKLIGALDAFRDVAVDGRRCLDAGASTGGFTDVLLRRGAREVVAVDVGYGQLVWRLQTDERVQRARPHQRPRPSRPTTSAGRSTWSSPTCPSSR